MPATEVEIKLDDCLVCGRNDWIFVREGADLCRPDFNQSFRLTRCAACGQVMQNPIPDNQQLAAAYSVADDYVCYRPAWKEPGWPFWKVLRSWTTSRRISRLKRYGEGHELLEVGCGAGDFLVSANKAGWNVSAVEYNRSLADVIRREFGFDIQDGGLSPNLWSKGQFDVVVFWNVLEHLQNPLHELTMGAAYLRPGGKVLLNLPSRQAAECGKWFGKYWTLLDLPRHISFFDKATLSQLCERAGLKLTVYKTPFEQSAWCYYMSCWNWSAQEKNALRWPRFLALASVISLILPYILIRALSGHGMDTFAVAAKPSG